MLAYIPMTLLFQVSTVLVSVMCAEQLEIHKSALHSKLESFSIISIQRGLILTEQELTVDSSSCEGAIHKGLPSSVRFVSLLQIARY